MSLSKVNREQKMNHKHLINLSKSFAKGTITLVIATAPLLAQAAGGLSVANETGNTTRLWVYSLLGIGCGLYVLYNLVWAMMEKKTWSDVLLALGHTMLAGASMVLVSFLWSRWGSGNAFSG